MSWISVKERLPRIRQEYLVYSDTGTFEIAIYFPAAGYTGDADWEKRNGGFVYPTHWMPLPDAPKEDE